jgi:hypothetical protein
MSTDQEEQDFLENALRNVSAFKKKMGSIFGETEHNRTPVEQLVFDLQEAHFVCERKNIVDVDREDCKAI